MKKFEDFVSEDYTVVGYKSPYPNYSIASSVPSTGYNMEPVIWQMNETANNLADEAHTYHNDDLRS